MQHTFYTLLFGLLMGYCICFGCMPQTAFAASRVLDQHRTAFASGMQTYVQNRYVEHLGNMKKFLARANHTSANQEGKEFQRNVLRSVYYSDYHAQGSFTIPWLPVKILDLSSLWKQQPGHQKKKDVYDYGE